MAYHCRRFKTFEIVEVKSFQFEDYYLASILGNFVNMRILEYPHMVVMKLFLMTVFFRKHMVLLMM